MRRIIATFILATIASPVQTQTNSLECVDPDIVTAFLGSWYSPARVISRDVPDEFAELSTPKSFSYTGSSVADYGSSVAFRTDLDPSSAESAILSSLETLGWRRLQQRERKPSGTGFQTATPRPNSVSLCHDDDTQMVVSARDEAAGTYVIVSKNYQQSGCKLSELLHGRMATDFRPRLELPPDVSRRSSSGSGGSNDRATSRVRFKSKLDSLALMSFFSSQLENQGWTYDSQWENPALVGSIWSANREKGLRLSGALQVVPENNSEFTILFSLWIFE